MKETKSKFIVRSNIFLESMNYCSSSVQFFPDISIVQVFYFNWRNSLEYYMIVNCKMYQM